MTHGPVYLFPLKDRLCIHLDKTLLLIQMLLKLSNKLCARLHYITVYNVKKKDRYQLLNSLATNFSCQTKVVLLRVLLG